MNFKFKLNKDLVKDEVFFSALKEINFEKYVNRVLDWYSKDNFEKWQKYLNQGEKYELTDFPESCDYIYYTLDRLAFKVVEALLNADVTVKTSDGRSILHVDTIKALLEAHIVEWLKGQGEKPLPYWDSEDSYRFWDTMFYDYNKVLWTFFDKCGYYIYLKNEIKLLHRAAESCFALFTMV